MINTKPTKIGGVADAPDIPRQAEPGPVTTSLGASSAQVQRGEFSANPPNPVQPGAVRRQSSQEQALRALYEAPPKTQSCEHPAPHGTEPPLAHAQTDSRRKKLALQNAPSAFESKNPDAYLERPSDPNKVDDVTRISAVAPNNPVIPVRQIRAVYNEHTVRVYQAYSHEIADSALAHGTFAPPFQMERTTWIKPSFLWMMYRSGWGQKDDRQKRILAIDITREGFEWALKHSCPTHRPDPSMSDEDWEQLKKESPVRIQWDPERNLQLQRLPHRAIQIGLIKEGVKLYTTQWICKITDVTPLAHQIHALVANNQFEEAKRYLPVELPYE